MLTLISESVPPRVIAAAQLTAKRRIHLTYVALHEVTWPGAGSVEYTERAETASVSRGTSHVTTKQRSKYLYLSEFRSCVKVEVAVLGFPS